MEPELPRRVVLRGLRASPLHAQLVDRRGHHCHTPSLPHIVQQHAHFLPHPGSRSQCIHKSSNHTLHTHTHTRVMGAPQHQPHHMPHLSFRCHISLTDCLRIAHFSFRLCPSGTARGPHSSRHSVLHPSWLTGDPDLQVHLVPVAVFLSSECHLAVERCAIVLMRSFPRQWMLDGRVYQSRYT